jgi:hypothetical protein
MQHRRDRWEVWRTAEPDVQPLRRGSALRRRRTVRTLTEEHPDALLRRWWFG